MTSDGFLLYSLRRSEEGFFDPYEVLALWKRVSLENNSSVKKTLKKQIEQEGLDNHPLLKFRLN